MISRNNLEYKARVEAYSIKDRLFLQSDQMGKASDWNFLLCEA